MANITAALVKELRDRTGAGMMECKKALVETNGDIEQAIENMRKNGQAKAAKKAGRTAAEGVVLSRVYANNTKGLVVELNCETDFVAKDAGFLAFANKVADYAAANDVSDVEVLKAQFEEERAHLVAKIGENMAIRRVETLAGDYVGGYSHGSKIAVLVSLKESNEKAAKEIGMHVAAFSPEYLTNDDIPADVIANERRVQLEIANEDPSFAKKPAEIQEKMIQGRISKFMEDMVLDVQGFVMDPTKTVKQYLAEEKAEVVKFLRVKVGEGIEKVEEDFAAEVAKVTGSFN